MGAMLRYDAVGGLALSSRPRQHRVQSGRPWWGDTNDEWVVGWSLVGEASRINGRINIGQAFIAFTPCIHLYIHHGIRDIRWSPSIAIFLLNLTRRLLLLLWNQPLGLNADKWPEMDRELKMRESSTNYNILADIFTCPLRYGNLSPDDQRDQEKCQACSAICFQFCPASLTCNSRIFQPLVNKGEWKRNVSRRSSSWTNYSVYVYKHMKSEAFLGKYTPARELFSSSASCNLHISLHYRTLSISATAALSSVLSSSSFVSVSKSFDCRCLKFHECLLWCVGKWQESGHKFDVKEKGREICRYKST